MSLGGSKPKNISQSQSRSTSTSRQGSSSAARSGQRFGQDSKTKDLLSKLLRGTGASENQAGLDLRRDAFDTIGAAPEAGGLTAAGTSQLLQTIGGAGFDAIPGQLEAISAPALRNLQRSVLPSISSEFAGDAGSGRGGEFAAQADAQEGVAAQIAAQAAGLQSAERDRQLGAAQLFPQIAESQARVGGAQLAAGESPLDRLNKIAASFPALKNQFSNSSSSSFGRSDANAASSSISEQKGKSGKGGALGTLIGGGAGAIFGGPAGAGLGAGIGGQIGSGLF